MTQKEKLSQWADIAKIAGAIIALVVLVLGGGFFYNEIWHIPDLRYTVLPTYDVRDVTFSGLVVDNRGRLPAHEVDIILTDLEHDIELLHMPGPYGKKAHTDWDPSKPANGATVEMERLPQGSSLPIYLLTSGPVTLAEGETFTIYSARGKARPSSEAGMTGTLFVLVGGMIALMASVLLDVYSFARKRRQTDE